jgi:hypothetical protein
MSACAYSPHRLSEVQVSGCYPSHPAAFFCAFKTSFRTFSAVLHSMLCMLFTFLSTSRTDISTDPAEFTRSLAVHTHYLGSRITDNRTFHIQLNITRKHFYISSCRQADAQWLQMEAQRTQASIQD